LVYGQDDNVPFEDEGVEVTKMSFVDSSVYGESLLQA